ncbi:hypothetical protein [Phaeobacter gallaeciensis]|nr:hypothetical protein [Phaeobacter gallaeciensis]MDE4059751.1 hypothetical protein [Phaeobacter gallaeciensis]MDE4122612.1 hypothetical protein [Phaeobacter gallaeciensis]MDE4127238.1 hypothetical protein [Phaeobacter gallaeciensis]
MTLKALNDFITATENAMTAQERLEWLALPKIERQAAAWAAYVAIHGAA